MAVKLKGKDLSMTTTARASWALCPTVRVIGPMLLLAAVAWSPCPASAGDSVEDLVPGAQLKTISRELRDTLEKAGFPNLEFAVFVYKNSDTGVVTIDSFAAEGIKIDTVLESEKVGGFTGPGPNQFDLDKEADGFRAVVVYSGSPGSGTDCRRAGTCASGGG